MKEEETLNFDIEKVLDEGIGRVKKAPVDTETQGKGNTGKCEKCKIEWKDAKTVHYDFTHNKYYCEKCGKKFPLDTGHKGSRII
ncbi:hypothetical protein ISS07_02360 [Candidatus Woesearchaeota archaeon]|nr:hypothetical protein [Candidatus Woesearchaeota archaeon]